MAKRKTAKRRASAAKPSKRLRSSARSASSARSTSSAPSSATPANKGRKFPAEILTVDEIRAMIRVCGRGETAHRNRALLIVLWRGGLRISEALALRRKDLDPKAGTVRIRKGKTRTVGLDPDAFAIVERWCDRWKAIGIPRTAPVFCTLAGGALGDAYVRKLLPRLATRAGIEKRVHPHGLRHTHAAELAREGIPINVIKDQLGHSNVATTSRYLDNIAPQHRIDIIQSRAAWGEPSP